MKWQTLALMILFGVAVLQVLIFYPKCPDVMVSQVGPQGQPTGRMTKPVFFAVSLGSTLFAALCFIGIAWTLPRVPSSLVSLPHRDYWFAPERRESTLSSLRSQLLWYGAVTVGFLICIFQLVIDANRLGHGRLSMTHFWILLGGYVAYTTVWCVRLILRFKKPV